MIRTSLIVIAILIQSAVAYAQADLAEITVEAGNSDRINTPVSVSLDGISFDTDSFDLVLKEEIDGGMKEVYSQYKPGENPRLYWVLDGETPAGEEREYLLQTVPKSQMSPAMAIEQDRQGTRILKNGKKVLQYKNVMHHPPEGTDPLYQRSGFIHPLWSPQGDTLTWVNPPDHKHHVGIWNPWTKTTIQGHHTDFWNLGEGQGTVRFAGFLHQLQGPVFAEVAARQEHVDFQFNGPDKTVMNEVWQLRVWNTAQTEKGDIYIVDFTSTLSCAIDSPIVLEHYRYGGGIGYRATKKWNASNMTVLSSEGKTRKMMETPEGKTYAEADGTRARWCDINGEMAGKDNAGILFLGHPENFDAPQPMRVWPSDAYEVGLMFFEFCPIRKRGWTIEPGQLYTQKYRMVVYTGQVSPQEADRFWTDYANPPRVEIGLTD